MRNGVAYELPTWEQRTTGSASFSSPLYPTPAASDWKRDDYPADRLRKFPNLPTISHYFPTPTTSDTNGAGKHGTGGLDLRTTVSLLPTPAACVANDGESTATWLARRERVKLTAANGNGMGMPLTVASLLIQEAQDLALFQTPSVADALGGHERRGGKRSTELLLNGQVKALHGESMNQPCADGNESTDQLPGQLNLLDAITDTA